MESLGADIERGTYQALGSIVADALVDLGDAITGYRQGSVTLSTLRNTIANWEPRLAVVRQWSLSQVGRVIDAFMAELGFSAGLPLTDPDIAAAQRDVAQRFDDFVHQLRSNLLTSLDRSTAAGLSPAETQHRLVHDIGLTEPHRMAVENYRLVLARQGQPLSVTNQRAADYSRRLLESRLRTWARTNAGRIIGGGQLAVGRFLDAQGLLPAAKRWVTARDERTCPVCRRMEGETVPWDVPWFLPNGLAVMVPAEVHPGCRCYIEIELEPAALLKAARLRPPRVSPPARGGSFPSWVAPYAIKYGVHPGELWAVLQKHGTHDQKTHGNWARGRSAVIVPYNQMELEGALAKAGWKITPGGGQLTKGRFQVLISDVDNRVSSMQATLIFDQQYMPGLADGVRDLTVQFKSDIGGYSGLFHYTDTSLRPVLSIATTSEGRVRRPDDMASTMVHEAAHWMDSLSQDRWWSDANMNAVTDRALDLLGRIESGSDFSRPLADVLLYPAIYRNDRSDFSNELAAELWRVRQTKSADIPQIERELGLPSGSLETNVFAPMQSRHQLSVPPAQSRVRYTVDQPLAAERRRAQEEETFNNTGPKDPFADDPDASVPWRMTKLDSHDRPRRTKGNPYRDANGRLCSRENAVVVIVEGEKIPC